MVPHHLWSSSIQDSVPMRANPVAEKWGGSGSLGFNVLGCLLGIVLVMASCRTARSWISLRPRTRRPSVARRIDPSRCTAPTPRPKPDLEEFPESLSYAIMPGVLICALIHGLLAPGYEIGGLLAFFPFAFLVTILIEQARQVRPHQALEPASPLDPTTVEAPFRNLRGRAIEREPTTAVFLIIAMIGIVLLAALPDLPGLAASLCLTSQPSVPDSSGAQFAMWMFAVFAVLFGFGLVQERWSQGSGPRPRRPRSQFRAIV